MSPCRSLVALAVIVSAVCAGAAAPPYLITDLGDLGGGESRGCRVNAAGQVAGYSSFWVESELLWRPLMQLLQQAPVPIPDSAILPVTI